MEINVATSIADQVCVCEKLSISIAREQAGICGDEEGEGDMYSALGQLVIVALTANRDAEKAGVGAPPALFPGRKRCPLIYVISDLEGVAATSPPPQPCYCSDIPDFKTTLVHM